MISPTFGAMPPPREATTTLACWVHDDVARRGRFGRVGGRVRAVGIERGHAAFAAVGLRYQLVQVRVPDQEVLRLRVRPVALKADLELLAG
jgi:hypothetical protein